MNSESPLQPVEYSGKQIRIIEATERLFAVNGFEGTSVRDIAQEAGVNVAMISYYFGSKEKLLEAVFTYRMQSGRVLLDNLAQDDTLDPMEKMHRIVENYVDRILHNQNFFRLMTHAQLTGEGGVIGEHLRNLKDGNRSRIKRIILEGQRKKIFKRSIDFPMLFMTLVGTLQYAISSQQYYRHREGLEDMPDDAFLALYTKKLKQHFTKLFSIYLTHES